MIGRHKSQEKKTKNKNTRENEMQQHNDHSVLMSISTFSTGKSKVIEEFVQTLLISGKIQIEILHDQSYFS